mmetsp:Transcript_17012/g.39569  ORF Transcript_17012/g.39569 Transcript_17012/m.39569 type:complete len:97 (-) Transcript_17012:289-579(-)
MALPKSSPSVEPKGHSMNSLVDGLTDWGTDCCQIYLSLVGSSSKNQLSCGVFTTYSITSCICEEKHCVHRAELVEWRKTRHNMQGFHEEIMQFASK